MTSQRTHSHSLDLSVIVPCYNEALNVADLVERVLRTLSVGMLNGELVLVDDGSKDDTALQIRKAMQQHPGKVVGVFHERNKGMAEAWRSGVAAARGITVAVIDADLQYQPEDILRLYRNLMESSVDVMQGWRSSVGRLRDGRYVLSRGLNEILNRTFGMHLRDNKSGFVCCAKEVMEDLLVYKGRYHYWQSFIMVAAHAKGYSYREIETLFTERKQGNSFLDGQAYRVAAKNLLDVGTALLEYRLRSNPRGWSPRLPSESASSSSSSTEGSSLSTRIHLAALSRSQRARVRSVERLFHTLQATQWLSPDEIRELQGEKLRRLIRHAYRNVPYYRARMQQAGLAPGDIRGVDDLVKLPLLTKEDIRHHLYFDIMQEGVAHSSLVRLTTSGNTGQPLICYADRTQLEFRVAADLRGRIWAGYQVGEPWVRLTHDYEELANSRTISGILEGKILNRVTLSVQRMTPRELDEIVGMLSQRTAFLDADIEVLAVLAQYIELRGSKAVRCRGIISSGQTLSKERRRLLERTFGCRVFDSYSSREFARIAFESDAEGHLVAAEGYVVEVLRNGEPAQAGEVGEAVITDLNGYAMPMIRYRIGDMVEALSPGSQRHGRGLPRLGRIYGRAESILTGNTGQYMAGSFLAHVASEYDYALARLRAVQRAPGWLSLRIVKAARYSDDVLNQISSLLKDGLGSDLRIDVVFEEAEAEVPSEREPLSAHPHRVRIVR